MAILLLVKTGGDGRKRVLKSLAASEPGLRIVCMNEAVNWAAPWVHDWIVSPMVNFATELEAVRTYMAAHSVTFAGVLSYDEYGVELAALLAEALGLPGVAPRSMEIIRNKLAMRTHTRAHGVPAPGFARVNGAGVWVTDEAALAALLAAAGLDFPLVVKPTHGAGKYAVRRVTSVPALYAAIVAFRSTVDAFIARWLLPRDQAEGLFVEEFLPGGPEVDVDFVADRGRVLFCSVNQNRLAVGENFIEAGGQCPPSFGPGDVAALHALTQNFVASFGTDLMGVYHFEVILTPQGPVPLELNPRIGGAETFTMVQTAYGVDLASTALGLALGKPASPGDFPTAARSHASSVNFVPAWEGPGRLTGQTVADWVRADAHFTDMELFYKPGDRVTPPPGCRPNMGWLVAHGSTAADAEAHLARLSTGVTFDFEPFS